jgi:hypothetical protein
VKLLINTLHDQTIVPLPAIQRGSDGTFVFVVSPDKTVNQRPVKTGVQDGERIAITEGLQPGDTVVVDGADRLRDGAQVTIPNPAGAITAPSAGGTAVSGGARGRGGISPAVLARVTAACGEDTKKLCSTPEQLAPPQRAGGAGANGGGQRGFGGPGGGGFGGQGAGRAQANMTPEMRQQMRVIGCLNRNRISLSAQCVAALPAQRQRGGGGGGGFP